MARSVAVRGPAFLERGGGSKSDVSLAESIILSLSFSLFSSSVSVRRFFSAASSSNFCLFKRSTSTLTPRPSPVSLSTSSQTLFLSNVKGIFFWTLSSRNSGFLSSSRFRRNRSSRIILSRAFFRLTWRSWRLSLFAVLKGNEAFGDIFSLLEAMTMRCINI